MECAKVHGSGQRQTQPLEPRPEAERHGKNADPQRYEAQPLPLPPRCGRSFVHLGRLR
jgi:hypothetical protein